MVTSKCLDPPSKLLFEGNKASQWSYILTKSFINAETIERLSTLPRKDVLYNAFAIREDNTGNPYIEGFIKTSRRHRVSFMKKLIGPAIFDVVLDVPSTLVDLHLKSEAKDFGDPKTTRFNSFREDTVSLKGQAGKHPISSLKKTFPKLFAKYSEIVIPYIQECAKSKDKDEEVLPPVLPPTETKLLEWCKQNNKLPQGRSKRRALI